jgi:hypothetical protein
MAFWIGENLTETSTLDDLIKNKRIKAMTWEDRDHKDDFNLPSFSIQFIKNPKQQHSDITVLAMMNQQSAPYLFNISGKSNSVDLFFDYDNFSEAKLDRPKDQNGLDLEIDNLISVCLGFQLISFAMNGAPKTAQALLFEGEEDDTAYPFSPHLVMLSLDGQLRVYRFYNTHWKEDDLLSHPNLASRTWNSQEKAISPSIMIS